MIHYQASELKAVLHDLHQNRVTGIIKITTSTEPARTRWLVLKNGSPTFCGTTIPSVNDFVLYLSRRLEPGRIEAAVRRLLIQHPNVDSVARLLTMLTRLRLFKWEKIETLVSMDTAMHLDVVLSLPGSLTVFEAREGQHHPFDLSFGQNHRALDWSRIWTLVTVRQKMWQRMSSCINSLDSVPLLNTDRDTLENLEDIAAREHLLRWVDGKRSLGAIAQATGEDPLFLGRNYLAWVERGWLKFADSNIVHTPVLLRIQAPTGTSSTLDHFLENRYQMHFAGSVREALIMMHMYDVGFALLETNRSNINGIEFYRLIRQSPKFMDLPLVLLATGDGSAHAIKEPLIGPTFTFTTPPQPKTLAAIIDQHVCPAKPGHYYTSKPVMTRKASEFLANFLLEGAAS